MKLGGWQGPPDEVKRCEIELSFKVSLFIQFLESLKQRQFVYFVCLGINI